MTHSGQGVFECDVGAISPEDIALFEKGRHRRLFEKLGAHLAELNGEKGVRFAVWAPNAESVGVAGSFNGWNLERSLLLPVEHSGVWEGFLPGVAPGALYKYVIRSKNGGEIVEKADPVAFGAETLPGTASVVCDLAYEWGDDEWMRTRRAGASDPVSVYEVHLGSWMRVPEENDRFLTYREIAPKLAEYVLKTGFTHVEFLPLTEHPFDGSWGYQSTGYFVPTSRHGSPQDFMALVEHLHKCGIGVILDWVPSHFPDDEHGLSRFDGSPLFEHEDPQRGVHPEWDSLLFNYERGEVRSFLISSALFWLEKYHIDGLRVDAVATMLYLDDFREEGKWVPNEHGGRENLEAIDFLRSFNEAVHEEFPQALTVAEESGAWPGVSRPVKDGGLGFDMKWDMGWMHDTLFYLSLDPIHRSRHHDNLTFRMMYSFDENYMLALSHDEVVHSKGSLLGKIPGDDWSRFATLRLLFGYMFAQPGKKLLFMGNEIGQWEEWSHERSLDWHLLRNPLNEGVQRWVEDLNQFYRRTPAMHSLDFSREGFRWIDCDDAQQSTLSLMRSSGDSKEDIVVVCNFTPVLRRNFRVGVPSEGVWRERLNSDAAEYGGGNRGNMGAVEAAPIPAHGYPFSVNLLLPPLAIEFLQLEEEEE